MKKAATRPPLLTVAQAAQQWNVSQKHIRRLISNGTLPVIALPSAGANLRPLLRISQQDLDVLATPFHFPAE